MRFFKFEGTIKDADACSENDKEFQLPKNINRTITTKSRSFNKKLDGDAFFYVADVTEYTVTVGALIIDCDESPEKIASDFLDAIQIKTLEIEFEEITFKKAEELLSDSGMCGFTENVDDVIDRFDLEFVVHRGRRMRYAEDITPPKDRKYDYEEAKKLFVGETLVQELDRIYVKPTDADVKAAGHPVHYMIECDEFQSRKKISRILMNSLYENGRLESRRCSIISITSDGDFSFKEMEAIYTMNDGGTVVIQYSGDDDYEDDRASVARNAVKAVCSCMKRHRNNTLTIFCLPRECAELKEIFYEYLGNTSFVEIKEEYSFGKHTVNYLKKLAKEKNIKTDKKLFEKFDETKSYSMSEVLRIFGEWYDLKLKNSVFPQYKDIITIKEKLANAPKKGEAYDELMCMIGLGGAKKSIDNIINYYKAQKVFHDRGMKSDTPSMHMVFTGNPGTAKTSVARLFARILKDNNILDKGSIVEVGRSDLVGKYVGWTAKIVKEKFAQARGGVLFIDEAYSLVDDRNGSFGDEAINTIVQEMENHRNDTVVIFAGYPDKTEEFLLKNPGLRSRIAYHIAFEDYSTEELCDIAKLIAKEKGLRIDGEGCEKLNGIFEAARAESDFGNGRYVRNVIEKAKMAQATRLLSKGYDSIEDDEITLLCASDFEATANYRKPAKSIGF